MIRIEMVVLTERGDMESIVRTLPTIADATALVDSYDRHSSVEPILRITITRIVEDTS